MTEARPPRRVMRQRERKAVSAQCNDIVRAYNRGDLTAVLRGLGAGEPDDWPQYTHDDANAPQRAGKRGTK